MKSEGTLQLLEDAVHLFRATPFPTLAWHWAGSLPFAIGIAFYWNHATHPRSAASNLATDALLLAVLLAWMTACRAIYAARLRGQLAGTPDAPLRAAELWRLAATQVFFASTKLVVLPFALLSVFFLAPTVAFYRNLAVLSRQNIPGARELAAQARRLAGHRPGQSWKALGLLACIYPLALVNIALTLAFVPQLLRILTGYESVYSRLGANLFESPTFWVFTFALTWLAFDPYIQAVYCVRCFEAESARTGEDIKSGLRVLRGASRAAAGLLFAAAALAALGSPLRAADTATPADLRLAVQQAAQSPEYDWRIALAEPPKQQPGWFVAATDRIIAGTRAFFHSIGNAIDRFFRWLFKREGGREPRDTSLPIAALPVSVYVLIALILAVCGFAFVRMRNATRPTPVPALDSSTVATPTDAEEMDPLRFPEQSWIELAERSLAEENWRLAMRAFYLASLAWLGRREIIRIHSGKTNREYELELRRRTRAVPHVPGLFSKNVAAFERSWYGMHELAAADVEGFRSHMTEIQRSLETAV